MSYKFLAMMFSMVLLAVLLAPKARADEDNQEIRFSINRPVDIPTSVLPAGHYDLKLMGNGSRVAGVWNASGTKFYGFFETIPVDRYHATSRTKLVLTESVKNAPPRIEEWFYPGDKVGSEILYPARMGREMAR
jgi:hypothetical protein